VRGADRKQAIADYKQRKTIVGVFAVRCAASGQVWVGESPHVDTRRNGLWASLAHGNFPNRTLQEAWKEHGQESFTFEPLDALPDDTSPHLVQAELKALADLWREQLQALRF